MKVILNIDEKVYDFSFTVTKQKFNRSLIHMLQQSNHNYFLFSEHKYLQRIARALILHNHILKVTYKQLWLKVIIILCSNMKQYFKVTQKPFNEQRLKKLMWPETSSFLNSQKWINIIRMLLLWKLDLDFLRVLGCIS